MTNSELKSQEFLKELTLGNWSVSKRGSVVSGKNSGIGNGHKGEQSDGLKMNTKFYYNLVTLANPNC